MTSELCKSCVFGPDVCFGCDGGNKYMKKVLPGAEEEADPNGKKPNEAGAKLDAGKNRVGLVLLGFARALQAVSEVGTYGAAKYTDDGWTEVPDGERRYTDAMLRHLLREATGEACDPDTGLRHAAHAAWNALARLDLALRRATSPDGTCRENGNPGMPQPER